MEFFRQQAGTRKLAGIGKEQQHSAKYKNGQDIGGGNTAYITKRKRRKIRFE